MIILKRDGQKYGFESFERTLKEENTVGLEELMEIVWENKLIFLEKKNLNGLGCFFDLNIIVFSSCFLAMFFLFFCHLEYRIFFFLNYIFFQHFFFLKKEVIRVQGSLTLSS